jgi:Tol biopolymer transport system component
MTKRRRNLILIAVLVALVVFGAAVVVGMALGGEEDDKPKHPGRIAVRHDCGIVHFFFDGSDQRTVCLTDAWDSVSQSWDGENLAWDTRDAGLRLADENGAGEYTLSTPQGANFGPTLSPDGKRFAFLHSARDDGRYDVWVGDVDANNAEQVTTTRDVTDVVWSPKGDWLAYVNGWSANTFEGQIMLVRPDGDDSRKLVTGDTPEWSPDGKQLVYVHDESIWTIGSDGESPKRIIPNGHSPAWSRDGELIAFMRAERCAEPPCEEHVFYAFADGQGARQVGPAFPEERAVLWLRDPFE